MIEAQYSKHLTEDERSILQEYVFAYRNYIKKICPKCVKNKWYNKRDCSLNRGFSRPSCFHMERAINSRKIHKQLASKIWGKEMKDLIKMRDNTLNG